MSALLFRAAGVLIALALLASQDGAFGQSLQDLQLRKQRLVAALREDTVAPYEQWLSERPPRCDSPTLERARRSALANAGILRPETAGIDVVLAAGGWTLDIADGAKEHGCAIVARNLYDNVIKIYLGSAYTALRDRARIGIDDLR